jgi:hypothetical protein
MKSSTRFLRDLFRIIPSFLIVLVLAPNARAQSAVAAQFPSAQQVVADYRDSAEAYVALRVLWEALKEKSLAPDALAKRRTYYDTYSNLHTNHVVIGGQAAADWGNRTADLTASNDFRLSVLKKYHVDDVSADPPKPYDGDVTDDMIKAAFLKALPFFLATLVGMYLLIHVFLGRTTSSPTMTEPLVTNDGLPPLPESLRTVMVPGLSYPVTVLSGLVVEEKSSTSTRLVTTTQPGEVYNIGNQFFYAPGSTTTTSVSPQTDLVWIKTPDRKETYWTFTGGTFKTRAGHLISAIARATREGTLDFLLAYNHSTGQLDPLGGSGAHGTRFGRWVWPLSALIGAIGFGIAFGIVLSIKPPQTTVDSPWVYPLSLYIEGLVASTAVGLILVLLTKGSILRQRNRIFEREYLPGFRKFFEQRSPVLDHHFASPLGNKRDF